MKLKDASLLRTQSYINGEWVGAADGRSFAVHNVAGSSAGCLYGSHHPRGEI